MTRDNLIHGMEQPDDNHSARVSATAVGATIALPTLAHAKLGSHLVTLPQRLLEPADYMVGPMPDLPQVSKLPNPPGFYLYADGHIAHVVGFCDAMRLGIIARAGFSRQIPYGVDVTTDAQKLWFLGRERFSPSVPKEIIATLPGMSSQKSP